MNHPLGGLWGFLTFCLCHGDPRNLLEEKRLEHVNIGMIQKGGGGGRLWVLKKESERKEGRKGS